MVDKNRRAKKISNTTMAITIEPLSELSLIIPNCYELPGQGVKSGFAGISLVVRSIVYSREITRL